MLKRWENKLRLACRIEKAVGPGSGLGAAGEGYVRMALVENENRLRQALRQMGRVLGQEPKRERVTA
jgi:alanine-synthesizing transaminase